MVIVRPEGKQEGGKKRCVLHQHEAGVTTASMEL